MGREEILKALRSALEKRRCAALVGMPGVGKTQTAIEYAHRHRTDYAAVLWAGADSPETLTSGYVALARLLGLPQRNEPDQTVIVAAVRRWLGATPNWLLILDNADHLGAVRDLLPADGQGHLLLTTRDPAVQALAQPVEVAKMTPEEGAQLLLRRAGRLAADAPLERAEGEDREPALALSRTLDGLPLALDQAGAYIVEKPSSPAEYLELYEAERAKLLADRGTFGDRDHASVSTTFALAFAKVEAGPALPPPTCSTSAPSWHRRRSLRRSSSKARRSWAIGWARLAPADIISPRSSARRIASPCCNGTRSRVPCQSTAWCRM